MFEPQDKIFNFIKINTNNENVKIFNKALSEKRLYFHLINTTLLHRYQL